MKALLFNISLGASLTTGAYSQKVKLINSNLVANKAYMNTGGF